MDPVLCCLMGLCCPPFSAEQRELFVKVLTEKFGADKAEKIAAETFDSFAAVTQKIAELAKAK